MKMLRHIFLFSCFTAGKRKRELLKLWQQQRQLLYTGQEGQAEVIHTIGYNRYIGSLQQVQLWLKLKRPDGSYIYTHSQTLVAGNSMPHSGHTLRIRYMPDNLSVVTII